jgi:hypothetical protein
MPRTQPPAAATTTTKASAAKEKKLTKLVDATTVQNSSSMHMSSSSSDRQTLEIVIPSALMGSPPVGLYVLILGMLLASYTPAWIILDWMLGNETPFLNLISWMTSCFLCWIFAAVCFVLARMAAAAARKIE